MKGSLVMRILRDVLDQPQNSEAAIGHFNVTDLVLLKVVFAAARDLKVPVLVRALRAGKNQGPPSTSSTSGSSRLAMSQGE